MRILFLGTPAAAVRPLELLAQDARFTMVGVVTQPDRPLGRTAVPTPPPVAQAAQRLGLPLLQPETLRDSQVVEQLVALRPDVGVVAAYGEILRRNVLAIPPLGYLNIHPSLLPRYRGPAPVTAAILAGDTETAVTIIRLDSKMDSGPILAQRRIALPPGARSGPLTNDLFVLGAELLLEALPDYAAGERTLQPQDHERATYTSLLRREDGQIVWSHSAVQIERMTRAYDPWPGAWALWRGQMFKILAATAEPHDLGLPPGTLVLRPDGVHVATGDGTLALTLVQPAGKRPLDARAWRNGLNIASGECFGV